MKRFIASLICATLAGLFCVSMEVDAMKTGYAIRKQEEMKVQLLDRGRALKYNIARLESPNNLERKLAAQKIFLEAPKEWQTLVLTGGKTARPSASSASVFRQPPQLLRFFVGTAQAEAKETR